MEFLRISQQIDSVFQKWNKIVSDPGPTTKEGKLDLEKLLFLYTPCFLFVNNAVKTAKSDEQGSERGTFFWAVFIVVQEQSPEF